MILLLITIMILAFICEYIDSSLGMGYGTILSPVLLIMGLEPFIVVPSILFSEAFTGCSSTIFHHKRGNVDFGKKKSKGILALISFMSVIATIGSVWIIVHGLTKFFIKLYIGVLVILMGLLLLFLKRKFTFSWKKIGAIGILSAFNKSISGGGFGPVVTAGQITSGRRTKKSIGITGACEVTVCVAGFIMYLILNGLIDLTIGICMAISGVLATPFATKTTMKIKDEIMAKKIVGLICIGLGIFTIIKLMI